MNSMICILYVKNIAASTTFYTELLGKDPVESHPSFAAFALSSGAMLGLWSRIDVEPAVTAQQTVYGNSELAFAVEGNDAVDSLYADWKGKGISMLQPPTQMDFGYTFTAVDADNNRLRVYTPSAM